VLCFFCFSFLLSLSGLSYSSCEYIYVAADLDEAQEAVYDSACRYWLELRDSFMRALEMTDSPALQGSKVFWGTHQRFFGQLCLSAKVHTVAEGRTREHEEKQRDRRASASFASCTHRLFVCSFFFLVRVSRNSQGSR
jgi:hypothetical protein